MERSQGTNDTMTFQLYKADVASEASLPVAEMDIGQLFKSFDNGEPVWMAADTVKIIHEIHHGGANLVKPYRLPNLENVCVKRVQVGG